MALFGALRGGLHLKFEILCLVTTLEQVESLVATRQTLGSSCVAYKPLGRQGPNPNQKGGEVIFALRGSLQRDFAHTRRDRM